MSYHKNEEINKLIIELLDALCTWERNSGRGSTLILIPHTPDERIVMAQDGKPVDPGRNRAAAYCDHIYFLALRTRKETPGGV